MMFRGGCNDFAMMFQGGCNDFAMRLQGGCKEVPRRLQGGSIKVLLCLIVTAKQVRKVRVDSEEVP
jgi:hypothetical protein